MNMKETLNPFFWRFHSIVLFWHFLFSGVSTDLTRCNCILNGTLLSYIISTSVFLIRVGSFIIKCLLWHFLSVPHRNPVAIHQQWEQLCQPPSSCESLKKLDPHRRLLRWRPFAFFVHKHIIPAYSLSLGFPIHSLDSRQGSQASA